MVPSRALLFAVGACLLVAAQCTVSERPPPSCTILSSNQPSTALFAPSWLTFQFFTFCLTCGRVPPACKATCAYAHV